MDFDRELPQMDSYDTDHDGLSDTRIGDVNADGVADTVVSWDAETGNYLAIHEDSETAERVAFLYDAFGVPIGAHIVDTSGVTRILDGDQAAKFLEESAVPQEQSTMVSQVPLDRSKMTTVEDITSSADYQRWDDDRSVAQSPPIDNQRVESMPRVRPAPAVPVAAQPPVASDPQVGDRTDANFWFKQNTDFTCGPAAATQIVEDFTGVDYPDEGVLTQYAAQNGWLTSEGMQAPYLAQMLTDFGVPATVMSNQDWGDIAHYLRQGRSVVMFVDGLDYWGDPGGRDELENSAADSVNHFVRIVAIDEEKGVAILSDSGTPNGRQLEVPLVAMEEAWNDVTGHDPVTNRPIRGHQLIVSTSADPTSSNSSASTLGRETPAASRSASHSLPDLLAPLRNADPDLMALIEGASVTPTVAGSSGVANALFRNPHGFAVIPLTLAASRIVAAARR